MPRRKKEPWDTPEIQALGAGFARQGYYKQGYGNAQAQANEYTEFGASVKKTGKTGVRKAHHAYLMGMPGEYPGEDFLLGVTAAEAATKTRQTKGKLVTLFAGVPSIDGNAKSMVVNGVDIRQPLFTTAGVRRVDRGKTNPMSPEDRLFPEFAQYTPVNHTLEYLKGD